MAGELEAHRKVNALNRCPQCNGDLDTGWECTACGYDASSHVVSEPRILTAEKLREEAEKAEARGAVSRNTGRYGDFNGD